MNVIPFLILTSGISRSFPQWKQISQVATSPDTCVTLNSPKHQPSLLSPLTLQISHHSSRPNQTWDNALETSRETRAHNDPTLFIALSFKSAMGAPGFLDFHLFTSIYFHTTSSFPKFIEPYNILSWKGPTRITEGQLPVLQWTTPRITPWALGVLSKHLCQA